MTNEQLSEKKQDFETAFLTIENIVEGEKIERFKFTPKEQQAFAFVLDLLSVHIKELEKF